MPPKLRPRRYPPHPSSYSQTNLFTDRNPERGPRPELLETLFNTPKPPESEDCLTINVFAPSPATPALRAVLVFVHGGGWQLGHGGSDLSFFAAYEDIIAITFNYRTNGSPPPTPQVTGLITNTTKSSASPPPQKSPSQTAT